MPLAEIHVTLKPALFDAQGETIKKALHQLEHTAVQNVRIGKIITLEIEGGDDAALQGQLDLMCQQLLANPVIEDYVITLTDTPASARVAGTRAGATPVALKTSDIAFDPIRDSQTVPTPAAPAPVAEPEAEAIITSRSSGGGVAASVSTGTEAVTTSGGIGISDPFTVDFRSYEGMPTEAKLALRTLALRKHGTWIEKQLNERRASWILCVGQHVEESGTSLDTYPSDQQLLKLGVARDLVPWVFTRPQP
jgi:phosphoribosylformylglycinamidine synthase PurS subunit